MRIGLRLTDDQLAVAGRLAELIGADGFDGLAAAAVAGAAQELAQPRWQASRPPAPAPGTARRPRDVALDAVLPAASAVALALRAGQRLRIAQVRGGQCVDLRAFAPGGPVFSAARTRANHGIHPTVGASLWSTAPETPLLTIVADTAPAHDLCFPPCSEDEYRRHAGIAGHRGCAELHAGVQSRVAAGAGAAGDDVLNLWLPSAVGEDGRLRSWPAACRRGDLVELRAEREVVVTLSTCPDDLFGSSQYEPGPVRVIVSGTVAGEPSLVPWPGAPPASALAGNAVGVSVPAADVARLDEVVARGWLGVSRAAALRALIFRLYERQTAAPAGTTRPGAPPTTPAAAPPTAPPGRPPTAPPGRPHRRGPATTPRSAAS
jgi:uncharacterized protein YcgI (DUF1989 family)